MTRVKRSVNARKKRRATLELTKGFRGEAHSNYKRAKEALLKADAYAYRDRRNRKRDFRRLWITRINAAARMNGMSYSEFMHGLSLAGVELDRGLIRVDGAMRTSRAGVYAIGDLVAGPALAHKASDEGIIAVEDAAGLPTHPIAYVDVPRATFCTPNVGSFGLTEAEAVDQGYDVVVGKVPYGAVGGGTVYGDRTGLVKVVGESRYGELLGGHIVGARATELIQELVNIRALEGGFPEVGRIIHGHPTLSEAVMEAGRAADGWLIHG